MVEACSQEIAVVDDDEAVLESFRFMLELAGFPVATYPSAMAFLEAGTIRPRCLIVDHQMPKMTGLELVAKLRADGVDVPVVLVTSAPSAAIRARAQAIGIRRVLEKPPREEDLIGFIEACARE